MLADPPLQRISLTWWQREDVNRESLFCMLDSLNTWRERVPPWGSLAQQDYFLSVCSPVRQPGHPTSTSSERRDACRQIQARQTRAQLTLLKRTFLYTHSPPFTTVHDKLYRIIPYITKIPGLRGAHVLTRRIPLPGHPKSIHNSRHIAHVLQCRSSNKYQEPGPVMFGLVQRDFNFP